MIGIIGAMEEEVAELKKDMQIEETVEMQVWYSAREHSAEKML